MRILVTGGAGYIGSHTVLELTKAGNEVVIFDNLIYGHKEAVNNPLIEGDLLNKELVKKVFSEQKFDGVVHFAAYIQAGESMKTPAKYFENNILGGLNLLEAMRENNVSKIVFSSSAAVYGYPKKLPIIEETEYEPVNVYGESKLMFEKILNWYDKLFGIKSVRLRYFNASGASLDGSIGEDHNPETHIIPLAMQVVLGQREKFMIFGDDYQTKDGTCVRDYVHVLDLASAHIKALEYLKKENKSNFFNVGTGNGYSNKEILDMVKKVTKTDFEVEIAERRAGDPDSLCADNTKIKKVLSWEPKYSELEKVISTAWEWHKKHPYGYKTIKL